MASSSIVPLKRPRPVKSCLRCRNKKLKCDREQPCSTCRNHGLEDCAYDERAGSLGGPFQQIDGLAPQHTIHSAASSLTDERRDSSVVDQLRELQERVQRLENSIKPINGVTTVRDSHRLPSFSVHQSIDQDPNSHGTSSTPRRTYGLNNTRSLVSLFPDALAFAQRSVQDPNTRPEFENLARMFPKQKIQNDSLENVSLDFIISALPSRVTCDYRVYVYTTYLERLHRILHVSTFHRQCRYFWDPSSDNDNAFRTEFVPQLAIVVSIGALLDSSPSSEFPLSKARKMLAMVEALIFKPCTKQRMKLESLQTSCLFILAKRMYAIRSMELWRDTGDLLRLALVNGLHKDPEEAMPDVPELQLELRRRLWYTIVELDIETSILCSMPCMVPVISYNCKLPIRNDDELLAPDEERLADTGNGNGTNDVTLQRLLAQSLSVRLRALGILTHPGHSNHKDLHATMRDLDICLNALGPRNADAQMLNPNQFSSYLTRMCIQGTIVSLITLCLQCPGCMEAQECQDAFIAYLLSCMDVMLLPEELNPDSSMYDNMNDDVCWKLFTTFETDNIIRAGYCACLCLDVLKTAPEISGQSPTVVRHAVRKSIDDVIEPFVKRFPDIRPVLKQIMALAVVNKLTNYTTNQSKKQELMHTGLQNFLQLCKERYNADLARKGSIHSESESGSSGSADEYFDFFGTPDDFGLDPTFFDWNSGFLFDGNFHTSAGLPDPIP